MNRVFILIVLLTACHPSPEMIKQVNVQVNIKKDQQILCPPTRINKCAIDSPLTALYQQSKQHNQSYASILEKGEDALLLRLHMIKMAQKSIDIQTFIWANDDAGHLVLAELLSAAKRGVKVNIIIDQLFSMGNSWFLAEVATLHKNLTVKMFNPIFNEGNTSRFDFFTALACCLSSLNRRMHNKLFLVDGIYGINGGRNYQNRYFDWDEDFNYHDRDVFALGNEVSAQMQQSFYDFWNSPWVIPLENLDDVAYRIINNQENHSDWYLPQKKMARLLKLKAYDYALIKDKFVSPAIAVDAIEYFSDLPEKLFVRSRDVKKQSKQMSLKIKQLILSTKKAMLFQTPYLVLSRKAYRALKRLRHKQKKVNITVSTNSLSSTDAYYVYAISYKHKRRYMKGLGLNIFEYKQHPAYATEMFGHHPNKKVRFGLHAKSIVIDDYTSMIGSHNFDHRSDVLNTESGFIIKSAALAQQLSAAIKTDMRAENSWLIAPNKKIPFFSAISGIIATFSRALPTLDIWPFRYSSSFQLRRGKKAVSISHPDFYKNYKNLGSFPDVELSSKQIQTIIISAFAGFAEPVM